MDKLKSWYNDYNQLSWVITLRDMFHESKHIAKTDYWAMTGRKQDVEILQARIDDFNAQIDELQLELGELQASAPDKRREQWFNLSTKTRVTYAHNRWLAKPKILVFTRAPESIGFICQLLSDSLRLARFLKRYDRSICQADEFKTREYRSERRQYYGLPTASQTERGDAPILPEWSLRRYAKGALLIWNYPLDDDKLAPEYLATEETLNSRALYRDLPTETEESDTLMDAARRAIGDKAFKSAVRQGLDVIQNARYFMKRYSDQPGDEEDERLPVVMRRWMKEVGRQEWMRETEFDPGRPYWEDVPHIESARHAKSLRREIKSRTAMKKRLEVQLTRVANGPTVLDVFVDLWNVFWFGVALAILRVCYPLVILALNVWASLYGSSASNKQ